MPLADEYYQGLQQGMAIRPEQRAVPNLGSLASGYGKAQMTGLAQSTDMDTRIQQANNQLADSRMMLGQAKAENKLATGIGLGNLGLTGYQMRQDEQDRLEMQRQQLETKDRFDAIIASINKYIDQYIGVVNPAATQVGFRQNPVFNMSDNYMMSPSKYSINLQSGGR